MVLCDVSLNQISDFPSEKDLGLSHIFTALAPVIEVLDWILILKNYGWQQMKSMLQKILDRDPRIFAKFEMY